MSVPCSDTYIPPVQGGRIPDVFFISNLKEYIQCTYLLWWSTYFGFLLLLRARRAAQPVCLPAIQVQAQAHALNQITLKHWQVYSRWKLAAPLSGRLGACAGGLLGDTTAAGQLHPTRRCQDQLSAHQQPQLQPATQCALQTGV